MDAKCTYKLFGSNEWQTINSFNNIQTDINIDYALICGDNTINNICVMPCNLTYISVRKCSEVKNICNFPKTIKTIHILYSKLEKLEKLPQNLIYLNCANNNIKYIDNFPTSLESCICNNNYLLHLPVKSNFIKLHKICCGYIGYDSYSSNYNDNYCNVYSPNSSYYCG